MDDSISPELYKAMDKIAAKYNQEDAEKKLNEIYQEIINERISLLIQASMPEQLPQPPMPIGIPVPTDPTQQVNFTEPPVIEQK